jgi:D-mannonate dehydratase
MKRSIIIPINYFLGWSYNTEIAQIKQDLEAIEKLGATHVNTEIEHSYGDSFLKIEAIQQRKETDEEYQKRLLQEKNRQEEIKEKELKQLEALKLKYEKL